MVQYRLLRNNKETGPYTKAQLKELGLKAYDLIWAEGKSAAWRYPGEIKDLEDFAPPVEEQPYDRFYKREKETPAPAKKSEPAKPEASPAQNQKKEKPRIRVTADWQKTDLKKGLNETSNAPVSAAASTMAAPPEWDEMYSDWKAKKPVEEKQKSPAKSAVVEALEPETDLLQPLPAMKDNYLNSVLKSRQQERSAFDPKKHLAWMLLIPIIAVGIWMGYRFKSTPSANKQLTETLPTNLNENQREQEPNQISGIENQLSPTGQPNPSNDNQPGESPSTDATLAANSASRHKTDPATTLNETNKTLNNEIEKQNNPTAADEVKKHNTAPINSTKNAATNPLQNSQPSPKIPPSTTAQSKQQATNNNLTPNETKPPVVTNERNGTAVSKPVESNRKKSMDDYIVLNNQAKNYTNGVEDARLMVKNKTDFRIDLAVVDVQYYDGKGKFQKGETIYVKNIPANNDVEIDIPDSKSSTNITYKVSLISAEQKTLYLIAD